MNCIGRAGLGLAAAFVCFGASVCSGQWFERQKVLALASDIGDSFGAAIAVDSDTAVVGSPGVRHAAHLLRYQSGWWIETQLLGNGGATYGSAVAITGGVAAVGSPFGAGFVGVFEQEGDSWLQSASLNGSDYPDAQGLGMGVAIAPQRIVAGAPITNTQGHTAAGTAYAFLPDNGSWVLERELAPPDPSTTWQYGNAVAASADWVLVGSQYGDGFREETGTAFLFDAQDLLMPPIKLAASDGQSRDEFAGAIALSDDVALIGAPQDDDAGVDAGAVYVFRRVGGEWVQHQKFVAPGASGGDRFGTAVALHGSLAVIGASMSDLAAGNAGAAFVFEDDGLEWSYVQTLLASDAQDHDHFGVAVAVTQEAILIGARDDDDAGSGAGSLYVFSVHCPADWNANGTTNTIDFVAFLNDWVRRRSHCDLNRDGNVNTQDFLAYMTAWAAGC